MRSSASPYSEGGFQNRKSGIFHKLMRRFIRNEDGNIAILFGFTALLLFGFVGAAVDYTRFNNVKSDIIESMDAAALAVTRYEEANPTATEDDLKDYGRRFFYENFRYDNLISEIDVDFTITSSKVLTSVTGSMKTKMLNVGFFDEFDMHTTNEIAKPGSGKIELALVLDVTGSMSNYAGGTKKIDSLRDAVDELLDVIDEPLSANEARVAIIPFNNYVNPGGASSWTSSWGDLNADALYHGARFFHVGEDGEVDMDVKVNHYNLFDSVSNSDWMGCVEARPYPLDELDTPPGTSASSTEINDAITVPPELSSPSNNFEQRMHDAYDNAPNIVAAMGDLTDSVNTRWVPMFVQDGIDCDASWRGRCPYYHGYSYWTGSETFNILGTPHTQTFWRSWFTDPSYDGKTESDYYNRSFLDDEDYIGRYAGEPVGRYAKIVADFHNLGTENDPLTADDIAWRDMLISYSIRNDACTSGQEFYDCDITSSSDGSEADAEEYAMRMAYVGWWDSATETYLYKFDQSPTIDESISDTDDDMIGPNLDCPAPILPLTSTRTDIETHMDGLYPNGATNSANGAVWGWRVLSPDAPFTEGSSYSDPEWQKAVVIMTDGYNTAYSRDTHLESNLTAYGYAVEERMGENVDDASEMRDEFDNKLLRVCQRMKDEKILVYTIVFGLDDADTEEVFQACATNPQEPYYYKAPSGEDLEEAFGEIAQNLQQLHISR